MIAGGTAGEAWGAKMIAERAIPTGPYVEPVDVPDPPCPVRWSVEDRRALANVIARRLPVAAYEHVSPSDLAAWLCASGVVSPPSP